MVYYAKDDQISTSPIVGGIEISEAQYNSLLAAKLEGRKTEVRDNVLWIASSTMQTVYSTADGEALEIPDNDVVPEGYTATPRPDEWHEWDGSAWVYEYSVEQVKNYRDAKILGVTITIDMPDSTEVVIKNDTRTIAAISSKMESMKAEQSIAAVAFEFENGFRDTTYADFQAVMYERERFEQRAFDAYFAVLDNAGDYSTRQEWVNIFEGVWNV